MSIFKCKMCGGTLEISGNETVATCEYCGTRQTLPRLDDEKKANLYDRANHFRRNNDYDKAAAIYEQILSEDTADAEAYWSLVLCRYGIEYVEDPATHKRIPTVNRAQFTSIFADEDYKSALQYADGYQKSIYEEEARAIDGIQKGILAISQKEEPFDVFICYKETDNNGRRTQDSVLANDLYHQLTQEGFKVFFARITLEDKLGTAYEPYIFAALNSAKVMVVLGTKPEHFNAVWVKNEWSRYLALVKLSGGKKMLIPAYRDMDPYDLPEEFSHLQAQDMSKLGFMQDLIRGIKKIAQAEAPKATVVKETVIAGNNANVAPLLKRAFMFLEDGDFQRADEFCEQVLNQNPENAEAYLGKLMAELKVKKREALKDCGEPFDGSSNYQKAVRFGSGGISDELRGAIAYINERNEQVRLDGVYSRASSAMRAAKTEKDYQEAAGLFASIPDYQDAAVLAAECREKAEIARKDAILAAGKAKMNSDFIGSYGEAIRLFASIPGWKDADEQLYACQKKKEADRLGAERKEEEKRIAAEKAAKKRKKIIAITAPIVAACAAFAIVLVTVIIPNNKYNNAVALMEEGSYEEAISAFEAMDGYKDSVEKIEGCKTGIKDRDYDAAVALMEAGSYEEAISAFGAMKGYKDSAEKIDACNTAIQDGKYNNAVALMEAGNYNEAASAFAALGDYKDSEDKLRSIEQPILSASNVGDTVFFGAYEQDNDESNGKENIEWRVLAKEDNRLLVISQYALDSQLYNTTYTEVTWETCTLRAWLNGDFINAAFSDGEKAMLPMATVPAGGGFDDGTDSGNATQDQIFLLSDTEAKRYFTSDSARRCTPTDYAAANGAYANSDGNCRWWLRSVGFSWIGNAQADIVTNSDHRYSNDGSIGSCAVNSKLIAVRPAMWIDLGA